MKLSRALVATLIFVLALLTTYYIHFRYFNVNVVFYAAIGDAFIATLLTGIAVFLISFFDPLGKFEKYQLLVIWVLLGYGFAISIPTVIDRSLSFYILEKLQQRGGGIKESSFNDIFTKEYVVEHRLIDVRLTEQLESGTIVISDGCVKLTKKGAALATFSRFYRKNLLPKKRLLMGQYTDDLTDPFRNSNNDFNYTCK